MSLVGPRPLPGGDPRHVRSRSSSPCAARSGPGLTGLWQVAGRSDLDMTGLEQLDRRYLDEPLAREGPPHPRPHARWPCWPAPGRTEWPTAPPSSTTGSSRGAAPSRCSPRWSTACRPSALYCIVEDLERRAPPTARRPRSCARRSSSASRGRRRTTGTSRRSCRWRSSSSTSAATTSSCRAATRSPSAPAPARSRSTSATCTRRCASRGTSRACTSTPSATGAGHARSPPALAFHYLRMWDRGAGTSVDDFVANSAVRGRPHPQDLRAAVDGDPPAGRRRATSPPAGRRAATSSPVAG